MTSLLTVIVCHSQRHTLYWIILIMYQPYLSKDTSSASHGSEYSLFPLPLFFFSFLSTTPPSYIFRLSSSATSSWWESLVTHGNVHKHVVLQHVSWVKPKHYTRILHCIFIHVTHTSSSKPTSPEVQTQPVYDDQPVISICMPKTNGTNNCLSLYRHVSFRWTRFRNTEAQLQ